MVKYGSNNESSEGTEGSWRITLVSGLLKVARSELGPEALIILTGPIGELERKPFLQVWYLGNYSQAGIDESEMSVPVLW